MNRSVERQKLTSDLIEAVKNCQTRFGGRSELATELDSRIVKLCTCLEDVLSHGLKTNRNLLRLTREMVLKGLKKNFTSNIGGQSSSSETITFWHVVRLFLNRHELERYLVLKNIHTDIGRGRAWIRSLLNENSLERHLLMILEDEISLTLRTQFYEDWAILMDQETSSILSTAARGLNSILFAINMDNPELNVGAAENGVVNPKLRSVPVPVITSTPASGDSGAESQPRLSRRKARIPRLVSLGGDENNSDTDSKVSMGSVQSAPATCLSSPESRHGGSQSGGQWTSSGSFNDYEINGHLGPNLMLTPVGEDNVSVGELALPSSEYNDEANASPVSDFGAAVNYERTAADTTGILELMRKQREENERLKAASKLSKNLYDELSRKSSTHIDALTKENTMLKVQVKKYISAIALLKQEGKSEVETSDEGYTPKNDGDFSMTSYNCYQEVNEYEKKLVQVAEMHGELVEFNDRLHRVILQKEGLIRKLREELVELRGPFPDSMQGADDDNISISSDFSSLHSSIQNSVSRPLISIWIPTAFMAGQPKSSSHHVYQVYVRVKDEEWNVYRRYSQFYGLNKLLKKTHPLVRTFDFPPKKTIGNRDAKIVQERRKRLEHYLRCVINALQAENSISNKRSLVEVLPFLGDRKSHRNSGPSRSSSVSRSEQGSIQSEQPHYVGL